MLHIFIKISNLRINVLQLMIYFKYKNTIKLIQVSQKQKLISTLNHNIPINGLLIGFQTTTGKYLDIQYLCNHKLSYDKQILQLIVIEKDQSNEEISKNSNIRHIQNTKKQYVDQLINIQDMNSLNMIIKSLQKNDLCIIFIVEDKSYKTYIIEQLKILINVDQYVKFYFYVLNNNERTRSHIQPPLYQIYRGNQKLLEMSLRKINYIISIQQMVNQYTSRSNRKSPIVSNQQSIPKLKQLINTTRINNSKYCFYQYLERMHQQKLISKQEYTMLKQQINKNIQQFHKFYCKNLTRNNYKDFRNQIINQLKQKTINQHQRVQIILNNTQTCNSIQQKQVINQDYQIIDLKSEKNIINLQSKNHRKNNLKIDTQREQNINRSQYTTKSSEFEIKYKKNNQQNYLEQTLNISTKLQLFYRSSYWAEQFNQMLDSFKCSKVVSDQLRKKYDENNSSIYILIRLFIENRIQNKNGLKKYYNSKQRLECNRIMKYNIFKNILKALCEQNKINQQQYEYFLLNFFEENIVVIASFQQYLISKDQCDFLETLHMIFNSKNIKNNYVQLEIFMDRLLIFLCKIYEHPNILVYTMTNYSQKFKGITQLYLQNSDISDFLENIDLLNAKSFEDRFKKNLQQLKQSTKNKKQLLELWQSKENDFVEGVIQIFQSNGDFSQFIASYAKQFGLFSSEQFVIPQTQNQKKKYIKEKIETLANFNQNLDCQSLIKYIDKSNIKFDRIWQKYFFDQNQFKLQQNLQDFLKNQHNIDPTHILKIQPYVSSPVLRKRFQQKSSPLMKLIRAQSQSSVSSEFKKRLAQLQQSQIPKIVSQTLLKLGIENSQITWLLQKNKSQISRAVNEYLSEENEEILLMKIDDLLNENESQYVPEIKFDFTNTEVAQYEAEYIQ